MQILDISTSDSSCPNTCALQVSGDELDALRHSAVQRGRGFLEGFSPAAGNPFADVYEWDYFREAPAIWARHVVMPPNEAVTVTLKNGAQAAATPPDSRIPISSNGSRAASPGKDLPTQDRGPQEQPSTSELVVDEGTFVGFTTAFIDALAASQAAQKNTNWRPIVPQPSGSGTDTHSSDQHPSDDATGTEDSEAASSGVSARNRSLSTNLQLRLLPTRANQPSTAERKALNPIMELRYDAPIPSSADPSTSSASTVSDISSSVVLTQQHVECLVNILDDITQQIPGIIEVPRGPQAVGGRPSTLRRLRQSVLVGVFRLMRWSAIGLAVGLPLIATLRPLNPGSGPGRLPAATGGTSVVNVDTKRHPGASSVLDAGVGTGGGDSPAVRRADRSPVGNVGTTDPSVQPVDFQDSSSQAYNATRGSSTSTATALQPINTSLTDEQLHKLCAQIEGLVNNKLWLPVDLSETLTSGGGGSQVSNATFVFTVDVLGHILMDLHIRTMKDLPHMSRTHCGISAVLPIVLLKAIWVQDAALSISRSSCDDVLAPEQYQLTSILFSRTRLILGTQLQ